MLSAWVVVALVEPEPEPVAGPGGKRDTGGQQGAGENGANGDPAGELAHDIPFLTEDVRRKRVSAYRGWHELHGTLPRQFCESSKAEAPAP